MSRHIRKLGPKAWLACGLGVWLVALVGVRASAVSTPEAPYPAPEKSAAVLNAPQPAQGTVALVGEDTCLTCHDDKKQGYDGSAHSVKSDPRTPASKQSCESCHGPGGKHVEDPANNPLVRFSKATPDEVNAVCTTCHSKGEHALWDGSQHENRGLSCVTCHSVHNYKSPAKQLKTETQRGLCITCHRDKIAKLDRSGHMPVREGKMECTSCHNVHGATNVHLLRKGDSAAELCTSCHADKRGPFLWEHAPVRDGCTTCHDPHGTSNERMLVAKLPLLCQRCHVATRHPSTIYDAAVLGPTTPAPSVRVYGRSCVTCHAAIHGSNHPSGQRFIR
jgi:DmsE family decaheme c-type cytochrome